MSIDQQIFDSLLEPIFVLNEQTQILYCNEPAALLTGLTTRKIMRSQPKITDIFQFSEPIEGLQNLLIVKDPTPYKEVSFPTPSGEVGKVQVTVQPFTQQGQWVMFLRDVTLEERLQKKYRAELDAKEGVIEELKKAQVALENYSKNLEKMVEERTAQIRELNQKLKALLDSLNQGFLIFDSEGDVWEVTSKACEKTLEIDPKGKKIWDVLKLPEVKKEGFRKWMITLFGELLPFEDMAALGPKEFQHSQGRNIKLEYYPIRNDKNEISGVVLVSTDITDLIYAQNEAEREKANSQFILKMFKQKRFFLRFFEETLEHMKDLSHAVKSPPHLWDIDNLFRILHTLKGGASSFSVKTLADQSHKLEDLILKLKNEPADFQVDSWDQEFDKLNSSFNDFKTEVESLLGIRSGLQQEESIEISRKKLQEVIQLLSMWSRTQDLAQQLEEQYLLENAIESFAPYSFIVARTAGQIEKKVRPLQIETSNIKWSPRPYQAFLNSLVHVFRNAVDHGLELPEVRKSQGKPEEGEIRVQLELKSNVYELCIQDDGGGINPFLIKNKLEEKGLSTTGLSNEELIQKIFDPQFSTKDTVTDLSGRGVGLDAVKTEIERIGGHVFVSTENGKGTQFLFRWPAQASGITTKKNATKAAA